MNAKSLVVPLLISLLYEPTAVATQPPGEPPTLTFSAAVLRALDYNTRLLDSRDAVGQAALSLNLARSEFGPQITPNMFGSFGGNDLSNQRYSLDFSQRFTTGTALRATVGSQAHS